jgi:molybdopterin/thiamine biosynthesis adenylyltransferase
MRDGRYADRLVIETELPFRGKSIPIEVVYPVEYPDEGPTFFGPPRLLDRHQHPRTDNFCWAEDSDRDWWPGMSAAEVVDQDIRWLLENSEAGPAAVRDGEANMPEPVSGYLIFDKAVVVVPDPFLADVLSVSGGRMTLVGDGDRFMLTRAANIGEADSALSERYFRDKPEHDGYWVALPQTPSAADSDDALITAIDAAAPRVFKGLARQLKIHKSEHFAETWLGVTFFEEGPLRGEQRRNWFFARIRLERGGQAAMGPKMGAQALTQAERGRRIPELVGLGNASVLVIGAGSVGAALVYELTKAGVGRVDVADSDVFDVNNSVRHVISPQWAGSNKAMVSALLAQDLNPFVTVDSHQLVVGGSAEDAVKLDALIATHFVVIDTTGSQAVARILARRCRQASTTLVVAGLSAGSYGAEIAVFRPGAPCFYCLVLAQRDGTIPVPQAAPPTGGVTPIGCSHPAFSGAGFDATELVAVAARTVVQATETCGYPPLDFDWAIINFRGHPRWQSGDLKRHPACPLCT